MINFDDLIITNSNIKNKLILNNANNLKQIRVKTYSEIINECFDLNNPLDEVLFYKKYGKYTFEEELKIKKVFSLKDITFNYQNITVLDYYYDNDIFNYFLKLIADKVNITYTYHYERNNKCVYVNSYDNQKDEVFSVSKRICKLLYNKVPQEKINIIYTNNDYDNIINEVFSIYKLPYSLNKSNSLLEYKCSKLLLDYLKNNLDEKYDDVLNDYVFYNDNGREKLINILNSYIGYDFTVSEIIDILTLKIRNTTINVNENKGINILNDYNVMIDDDSYIFILGVNQDIIPKVFKDDQYLKDDDKVQLGISSSTIKNKYQKKMFKDFIVSYHNLFISYSKSSMSRNLVKSSILQELEKEIELREIDDNLINESYSFRESLYKYNKLLDNYKKYKQKDEEFNILSNCDFKKYQKYNSANKVFKTGKVKEVLDKGILLSYTSISEYYKCPYSFYLNRVLKIKKESNFDSILLGNLFHDSLYNMLTIDKKFSEDDVKAIVTEYYKKSNVTINKVFLDIYSYYLYNIYLYILKTTDRTLFKIESLEKEYKIPLSKEGYVLNGKIDKVLKTEIKGKEYAVVLDYKTGTSNIDLNKVIHGHDMQLLFYFYFLSKESNVSFGGGYLQHILPNNVLSGEKDKIYSELLDDYYKYTGYSNDDLTVLSSIDRQFDKDSYLKGIAVSKKSLELTANARKRTINDLQYEKLLQIVYDKIEEACNSIYNCEFPIKPSYIDSLSCSLCVYNDICYYNEKDINILNKYKDLSFIKEDCDDSEKAE